MTLAQQDEVYKRTGEWETAYQRAMEVVKAKRAKQA